MKLEYANFITSIGQLTILVDDLELIALLPSDKVDISNAINNPRNETIKSVKRYLNDYFTNEIHEPNFPIRLDVTPFRKKVLEVLKTIPFGTLVSYKELGELVLNKYPELNRISNQSIGGALGANPILIIFPCHRVIKSNNTIGGFAYGIENKIILLEHENHQIMHQKNDTYVV